MGYIGYVNTNVNTKKERKKERERERERDHFTEPGKDCGGVGGLHHSTSSRRIGTSCARL